MRILITGGAGCLGSNLSEHFLDRGHQIFIIDNFATGHRELVPHGIDDMQFREGDVADRAFVEQCFAEFSPSHVIHAAAAYKDPDNWENDARTNVLGSIEIARVAQTHGVKRLINLQTALCYGQPDQVPIPVSAPTRPFISYGISKTAGEQFMLMGNVATVSLRLANICGPRLAIGPIPTFYTRLKAGKDCFCSDTIRDFLDMEDFLNLMDMVMVEDAPTGVFNVSTGQGKSIKQVYDAIADTLKIAGGEVPIVPPGTDDVKSVVLDPAFTNTTFGWRAEIDFEETIGRMLAWYDAHGVSAIHSHLKPPQNLDE